MGISLASTLTQLLGQMLLLLGGGISMASS